MTNHLLFLLFHALLLVWITPSKCNSNTKQYKFSLAKDECVKKCHDKEVIQQVVDLCKNKKDLLCKAKHDCEEKIICDCKIKFLCDKVHTDYSLISVTNYLGGIL